MRSCDPGCFDASQRHALGGRRSTCSRRPVSVTLAPSRLSSRLSSPATHSLPSSSGTTTRLTSGNRSSSGPGRRSSRLRQSSVRGAPPQHPQQQSRCNAAQRRCCSTRKLCCSVFLGSGVTALHVALPFVTLVFALTSLHLAPPRFISLPPPKASASRSSRSAPRRAATAPSDAGRTEKCTSCPFRRCGYKHGHPPDTRTQMRTQMRTHARTHHCYRAACQLLPSAPLPPPICAQEHRLVAFHGGVGGSLHTFGFWTLPLPTSFLNKEDPSATGISLLVRFCASFALRAAPLLSLAQQPCSADSSWRVSLAHRARSGRTCRDWFDVH